MIKAVVFDLDGTLLDRDSSLLAFIDKQYSDLGRAVKHIPKDKFISRFIELDAKGYVWKDQVYKQLIEELKIESVDWQTLLEYYVTHFKHHCIPFPHLITMLESLTQKPIRLAMITNGRGQFQMDNILALGIKNYFDDILISEWEGVSKPNSAIFLKMLNNLSIAADEAVYIGDHPKNDIQAAKAIGMKTIWKKDRHWDSVDADEEVDSLHEIIRVVEYLIVEENKV